MEKGANTDYIYIRAWHLMTGSYQHYIDALVARARRDGAPKNAVYYDDLFRKWVTVDGIASPESRARLLAFAGRLSATSTI